MSKHILVSLVGLTAFLFTSCYPYIPAYQPIATPQSAPAPQQSPQYQTTYPSQNASNPNQTVTSPEQKEIRQQEQGWWNTSNPTSTAPEPPKKTYPTAVPIPGKQGYVFNPYNNNAVYVQGISAGKTVLDPEDPNKEHKFIVP